MRAARVRSGLLRCPRSRRRRRRWERTSFDTISSSSASCVGTARRRTTPVKRAYTRLPTSRCRSTSTCAAARRSGWMRGRRSCSRTPTWTSQVRTIGPRKRSPRSPQPTPHSESVFFLPGKNDMRQVRQLRELQRAPDGGTLFARFMVRGHWRRPAKSWTEQGLRWIEPYWKGPDMASVIEKAYRLKA